MGREIVNHGKKTPQSLYIKKKVDKERLIDDARKRWVVRNGL